MRTFYREQKYVCGKNYIDIQIFPVYPTAGKMRKVKRKPSSETQARLNEENAKKKLSRLVHTNFTKKDIALTLTYDEDKLPADVDFAKKDIQNFMRRLKRLYKKIKINIKYIWVLEESASGRIHFHVFASGGADRTEIENLWQKGYANSKSLRFTKDGVEGLVIYSLKSKPLTYRRWSCSKNLEKPYMPRPSDYKITRAKAKKLYTSSFDFKEFEKIYPDFSKTFKEYSISQVNALYNEVNHEFYFNIKLYKTKFLL